MSEARLAAHGLRNVAPSLAPLLTSVGAYALGACVVVERAFVLPGLGSLGLDAASRGDAPVLAGLAALAGGAVATLSVVADLGARLADPREELA
jgi:peptide/nickel transport system permease protein